MEKKKPYNNFVHEYLALERKSINILDTLQYNTLFCTINKIIILIYYPSVDLYLLFAK